MTYPKTVKAVILAHLICSGEITEGDIRYNSFRSRVSDIQRKDKIKLSFRWKKFTTVFGYHSQVKVWILPSSSRNAAIELYNKINGEK